MVKFLPSLRHSFLTITFIGKSYLPVFVMLFCFCSNSFARTGSANSYKNKLIDSSLSIPGRVAAGIPSNFRNHAHTQIVAVQHETITNPYNISETLTALNSDAMLANLTLSSGTLSPAFAATTKAYSASVPNAVTSVNVTPTTNDPGATLTVNGAVVVSGSASPDLPLNAGNNSITIIVTSQDGSTTDTYTVTVIRAPSSDDTLSDLSISNGILSPAFASGTTAYVASVKIVKKQHTIYTIGDSITANGSYQNDLDSLLNGQFQIVNFAIPGDLSPDMINRFPAILQAKPDYVIILAGFGDIFYGATTAQVEANLQTMYDEAHNAGIKVIALTITPWKGFRNYWTPALQSIQDTVNAWIATAPNVDYVIDTYNALLDPSNPWQLLPPYDSGDHLHPGATGQGAIAAAIFAGTSFIPNPVVDQSNAAATSVAVTPTTSDANATAAVNGTTVASGTASPGIPLSLGSNIINTLVTAQDGTTNQTYTINVTGAPSNIANLANLSLSAGGLTLSPLFASNITSYSTSVFYNTDTLTVVPATIDANATITVNGMAVISGKPSAPIILSFGANTITTVVTAQDGTTTQTYTVSIIRPLGYIANLTNLAVSSGTLAPAFAQLTTSYTDTVINTTSSITITPAAFDVNATVTINGVPVPSGSPSANLPLNVGPNYYTIRATAQNGTTIKTYSLVVTRRKSSYAALTSLAISSGTLSPAFATGINSYTASVSYTTTTFKVTPTTGDATATIKVNGLAVASGSVSGSIPLNTGLNTISAIVTAQDGTTVNTYTIIVTRTSSNANLANLAISSGTLTPAFAAGTSAYSASVVNAIASITVTPFIADAAATVKINGSPVNSGAPSSGIPLAIGANSITIKVTAFDGTVKTYSLTVTRPKSSNASLANLTISNGTLSPSFTSSTLNYSDTVGLATTVVTATPTTSDATATMTVNGSPVVSGLSSGAIALSLGNNPITITVTAQDGTINTYTVTVSRLPSSNARLANLSISNGALSPSFLTGTTNYTDLVSNSITSVAITPTTSDPTATVTVNGIAVVSGNPATVPLNAGSNTITTIVTAQDGTTTNTYSILITRLSPNANLANLVLSSGTLSPAFAAGTNVYTSSVVNTVSALRITPTTSNPNATVTINGTAVPSGTASPALPLNIGPNYFTLRVTAQDGTLKTYSLTVTRVKSSDATLAGLALSTGTLSPVFAAGLMNYTALVSYATAAIKVTPTASNAQAVIKVNSVPVISGTASANIALATGLNTITIGLTSQDGTSNQTNTITVTRTSPDANLVSLVISSGNLSPAFAAATNSYKDTVANAVSSVTVTPTSSDAAATVTVNNVPVVSGTASAGIPLAVGFNVVTVKVTAQNGTVKTYAIIVTRKSPGALNSFYEPVSVVAKTEIIPIEKEDITVHPGVSPNGDGINDFLTIDGITNYPNNKLTIIDRNGALVFEAKGYDNSARIFDGHSSGGAMQLPGTYFYSLDYAVKGQTKHKTGYIILKY